MTFSEWIFSTADNPSYNGQWKLLHIATLIICIEAIVFIAKFFKEKDEKTKKTVINSLVGVIIFFEIARRILNLIRMESFSLNSFLYIMLPRPWCAISCWVLIIAIFVDKKSLYNFATICSLLCAMIFFAYPSAGFVNEYILFENIYSIITHSMLLITSISLMTLNFTEFRYRNIIGEVICFEAIYLYAFLEIFVLKIAADPLYFMPVKANEVYTIIGLPYIAYIAIYILFLMFYVNLFYLIDDKKIFSKIKSKFSKK